MQSIIGGINSLELADEEAGAHAADVLGQEVLGEEVDEGGDDGESEGGLVDPVEGNELGHAGVEHRLL